MTVEALIKKLEEREKFLLYMLDDRCRPYINGELSLLSSVIQDLKKIKTDS